MQTVWKPVVKPAVYQIAMHCDIQNLQIEWPRSKLKLALHTVAPKRSSNLPRLSVQVQLITSKSSNIGDEQIEKHLRQMLLLSLLVVLSYCSLKRIDPSV